MPFAPAAEAARSGDRTSNSAWLLGAGLVLVIGVRAYYLVLARDQPVWWDEAEYLIKARALALGTPDTGFFSGRPLLLSLVMAAIYAVGLGELTIRVGLAMVSTATIYMTYRVSLRIVDQSAAIVTAALVSMFYLQLFYTNRIMTEIPSLALVLLGVELFFSGEGRFLIWSAPILMLAALTRFPAALMFSC